MRILMNCEASTLVIQTLALLCSTKLATAEPSAFYFPTEQNASRIPPWDAPPQVYFGPFISLAPCWLLAARCRMARRLGRARRALRGQKAASTDPASRPIGLLKRRV